MSEVLCFSGGVDSFVAWYKLGMPRCIHFTGHSRYSYKELQAVRELKEITNMDLGIVDVSWMWASEYGDADAWIPGRNLTFAIIASYFGDKIYIPCQRGERDLEDRSEKFFNEVSELLSKHWRKPVVVDYVWKDETKIDLVAWYLNSNRNIEFLKKTVSCFSPMPGRCGVCKACFRLAVALEANGVSADKEWFHVDPFKTGNAHIYAEAILAGRYEERRAKQMLEVLMKKGLVLV